MVYKDNHTYYNYVKQYVLKSNDAYLALFICSYMFKYVNNLCDICMSMSYPDLTC